MLNTAFDQVRKFLEASNPDGPQRFAGNCNVSVRGGNDYMYRDIYVSVYYQVPYMDYKVQIVWEDDETQPEFKSIGLHGEYSTNFQTDMSFSGGILSFKDGINEISIILK